MGRSFVLSGAGHFLLALIIVTLSLVSPPRRIKRPVMIGRLLPPAMVRPTPRATPPPPKSEPARPQPTPRPTRKRAEPESRKEIVKKDPKVVEAKATPTPRPISTPAPTPIRTPRPTPPPSIPEEIIQQMPKPQQFRDLTMQGMMVELSQTYGPTALMLIEQHFTPPYTLKGVQCVAQFKIMRNGEIREARIVRSTGISDLDQAALRALKETKLPPLYQDFKGPFAEVQVTFEYLRRR